MWLIVYKKTICYEFQLRNALANIYIRGAVPVKVDRKLTSSGYFVPKLFKDSLLRQEEEFDNLN